MTSTEEHQIQQAMKLLEQYNCTLPGFKIHRMLEQKAGLGKQTAEATLIEAEKRLRQQRYDELEDDT